MKLGISIKIDVTKIDKARLFKGEKGTYMDLTTFINLDEEDQYGNHGFIAQSVSKEEKDNGVQTAILGNSKVFFNDSQSSGSPSGQNQSSQPAPVEDGFDDDIPF